MTSLWAQTVTKTITAIAILALLGSAPAAEIRLRSSAICPGSVVRLADVAEVLGEAQIAAALADVALCPTPAAGQQRVLSQEDIRRMLAFSGLSRKDCQVTGSETVKVTSAGASGGAARPRQPLVASGVRQALFEADERPTSEPNLVKPATSVSPAPAEASKLTLVERGASVSVLARTAGIRITTSGKALEAGQAGDLINVELADTKQRVLATVVGVQAVEVVR